MEWIHTIHKATWHQSGSKKWHCIDYAIMSQCRNMAENENILTVLLAFSTLHSINLNCSHILLAVKQVTVLWYICSGFGIMVTVCNHTQLNYLLITNYLITAHYFSLLYLLWSWHSCVSVKENMQCTWVLCMYIYYLKAAMSWFFTTYSLPLVTEMHWSVLIFVGDVTCISSFPPSDNWESWMYCSNRHCLTCSSFRI